MGKLRKEMKSLSPSKFSQHTHGMSIKGEAKVLGFRSLRYLIFEIPYFWSPMRSDMLNLSRTASDTNFDNNIYQKFKRHNTITM